MFALNKTVASGCLVIKKARMAIAVGMVAAIWSATAQVTSIQERDIGIRNQQELQRQQQIEQLLRQQHERTPDVRLPNPEKSISQTLPIETPCFLIERFELKNASGESLPKFDWVVEQLTAPDAPAFLGQCVGSQGVAWLIEQTQKILVDRGFVIGGKGYNWIEQCDARCL